MVSVSIKLLKSRNGFAKIGAGDGAFAQSVNDDMFPSTEKGLGMEWKSALSPHGPEGLSEAYFEGNGVWIVILEWRHGARRMLYPLIAGPKEGLPPSRWS